MRLLFVSSTTVGGSGRSQRELARQLALTGHTSQFLADDESPARFTRWLYGHLSDLAVRTAGRPGQRIAAWLERRPGRRTRAMHLDGWDHHISPVPQNALAREIDSFQPDVVVGNSLERLAWRRVHRICEGRDIPSVLYVRETDSLDHLTFGEIPDLLVANAESLQEALRARGFSCEFVPSVVDPSVTLTASTRSVALSINPIESRGADILWKIAAAAPELPIVAQESWPLQGADLAAVQRAAESLSNIEFRRQRAPGPDLYADTRVLLVPYRIDNRPRVIAEVQASGIPVIAADVPALREGIGEGGVVVPLDDIDAWVRELRSLYSDEERYERLSEAALVNSKRPEIEPGAVAASFERLIHQLVGSR